GSVMADSNAHNAPTPAEQALARRFAERAPSFARRRDASFTVLVGFGSLEYLVRVREGCVDDVVDRANRPLLQSFDFTVKALAEAWGRFWQTVPPAGSHDVFALARSGQMMIDGNLHLLMAHLQFVKDLLAI